MQNKNKLFQGAGVIVCEPDDPIFNELAIIVRTEYAKEVSAVFFALKKVFSNSIDHLSKYEFYGRLAEAANAQLDKKGDCKDLQKSIISEACTIASEMKKHLYFAYGSNMDKNQMEQRCPNSIFAGTATLPEHEFALDRAGAATVKSNPSDTVYGALWLITEFDEERLDVYEGVRNGCYRKTLCSITNDRGSSFSALVYISNREDHDGKTYRTGYMDNIIQNARLLEFDPHYVEQLESRFERNLQ